MRPHGILLAAGAGSRMGMPKALVHDEDGTSWLVRGVRTLAEGGCARVSVVLGASAARARGLLAGLDVAVVEAPDWAEGMSASLRAGLAGLAGPDGAAPEVEAALISLVDLTDLTPAVVRRVVAAGAGPTTLARASYDGEPGHPVLIGREHWAGVLDTAAGDRGARDYLVAHETALVECGDLATGRDVDTR